MHWNATLDFLSVVCMCLYVYIMAVSILDSL